MYSETGYAGAYSSKDIFEICLFLTSFTKFLYYF